MTGKGFLPLYVFASLPIALWGPVPANAIVLFFLTFLVKIMSRILLLFCLFIAAVPGFAQEIKAVVIINTPKLQRVDPKVFKTLTTQLTEFFNDRKWSDNTYLPEERIELTVQINIDQELSDTRFTGQLLIQSSRPIFNSGYNTALLEWVDKDFTFDYVEFEALDFSDNQYFSNLTSVMGYYAYVVLGLDADTFSELGGEAYFQKAQNIVNYIPQNVDAIYPGWRPFTSQRNRYWLVENLMNVRMKGFRRALYGYHMAGLDILSQDAAKGQQAIKKALEEVKKASNDYPATMIVQLFVNAKREEIVSVFTPCDLKVRQEVFEMMSRLDGTNAETYRKMIQ